MYHCVEFGRVSMKSLKMPKGKSEAGQTTQWLGLIWFWRYVV